MTSESSTVDVVERIGRGERSAEEELVRSFYRPVYAMVLTRTGDPEAAQDLTQETLIAVLRSLRDGKLHNPQGLVGFICGTMRNRVKHHFRSLHLERKGDLREEPAVAALNPEEAFSSAERKTLVNQAIEALNPIDQKILRLTLVEGLAPRQIGKRLGLSSEVVRQRKSRAIRTARAILRDKLSRK